MISLPKNIDPNKLKDFLLDLITTLENQSNAGPQLYVLDRKKNNKWPKNPKRRDILFRIKKRDGIDKISLYWFDGKEWQPLQLSAIDGTITTDQIDDFTFLSLTDTPDSYTDRAGQVPVVNNTETGLEFQTIEAASGENCCCEILVSDEDSPPVMLTDDDETDFLYSDECVAA